MIYKIAGNKTVVYRFIKVKELPFNITIVRDPHVGGFTAFMYDFPKIIAEGETLKEAISGLIDLYNKVPLESSNDI